jgi:protein-S-isoprenylcysteine O-methyltransferase Ste14
MSALVTIVIAVVVFLVAAFVSRMVPQPMRTAHPWVPQAVIKPLLIAISIGLMFAMRRPLADFGFRRATRGSK